ncbi:MAG: DUF3244 domain-containing protein [Bacteroidales bacterium]|nr:DUF3244 domain-containing protein [Lentimicrobiaceae bacterium]MBQ2853532.1 DUF3244 domain-containing protein [Bacteroidales bacterium]
MKKIILILIALFQFVTVVEAYSLEVADKVDIVNTGSAINNGLDYRSQSISVDLNKYVLTVDFGEDIGSAHIVISNALGVCIDRDYMPNLPDSAIFIIQESGRYRIDITLDDGTQYYGVFQVVR